MALRLIEIILPKGKTEHFSEWVKNDSVIGFWKEETSGTGLLVKVLLSAEKTEEFLDELEQKFSHIEGFHVVMLPVEATLPRYEEKNKKEESQKTDPTEEVEKKFPLRISREELFAEVRDSMKLSKVFVAMVILSSIVAAIGLLRDNVAVVIGAMVIAPLLGPNVGLAFATTLGDFELGRNALKTNIIGVSIALALSIGMGYFLEVNPEMHEISSRTEIQLYDIALALASGCAGVLAFTSGISAALIGVMVAVALLPPLVVSGLLVGSGNFLLAREALMLLLTNIICVNLAGVTTFLVQGVQPRNWWKANKAKKATRWAILIWSSLLVILVIVILLSQKE